MLLPLLQYITGSHALLSQSQRRRERRQLLLNPETRKQYLELGVLLIAKTTEVREAEAGHSLKTAVDEKLSDLLRNSRSYSSSSAEVGPEKSSRRDRGDEMAPLHVWAQANKRVPHCWRDTVVEQGRILAEHFGVDAASRCLMMCLLCCAVCCIVVQAVLLLWVTIYVHH